MAVQRGQIYLLKTDRAGKRRPVVIISRDSLNSGNRVVAIPFFSQQLAKRRTQPWCVPFSAGEAGLTKDCVAKTDEVSLIDVLELDVAAGFVGELDAAQLTRLENALRWTLGLH